MIYKTKLALAALALAASVSIITAQNVLWSDDFSDPNLPDWRAPLGGMNAINQQLLLEGVFGPAQTNDPLATYLAVFHPIPVSGPLPDNQALEARIDLVGVSENDAWASLHFFWPTGALMR